MFGDTHSHWFWLGLLLGCIMPLSQWTICYATLLEFLWYTLSHQQRMHCPFLQVSASASLFFSSPDITSLAVPQCVAVAEVLGLPAALPGTHVAERRRQISDHLGCALW